MLHDLDDLELLSQLVHAADERRVDVEPQPPNRKAHPLPTGNQLFESAQPAPQTGLLSVHDVS